MIPILIGLAAALIVGGLLFARLKGTAFCAP